MPPWRLYVEKARQAALGITVTIAFTTGGLYVFYNATYYGLRKFKRQKVARSEENQAKSLSLATENIVWDTLDAANVSGFQRGNMLMFPSKYASRFSNHYANPVWRGSLHMRAGSALGIPFYFNWNCKTEVDLAVLAKIWNIDVKSISPLDKEKLTELCCLSDAAKKFAIARSLGMMYNNEVLYGILHFELFLFTSLMTSTYMWNARAPALMNFFGFLTNYALWRIVTYFYRRRVNRKAIESAVALSPETMSGADEFYEKLESLNALVTRLRASSSLPNIIDSLFAHFFSIRPSSESLSLEFEKAVSFETKQKLQIGELEFKPICRGYVAAGKRMAMPPVPILPTSEAVSEPDKFLKRSGYEGNPEVDLLNSHFQHLQKGS